jgi:hypothetical protein
MSRGSRNILLALLTLGIAVRVRQFAAFTSYWYDEAYLLLNIFHKSLVALLGPLGDDQGAPPLFLWLLRGLYGLAGGAEGWMRLPALSASLVGLLLMAPLARRVVGRRGWVWAIAFCALGHHAAAHAGEVKPYSFDFLMTEVILLATVSCQRVVRKFWPKIALCVLAVLAPWASYPAVFVLGAATLALVMEAFRHRFSVHRRTYFTLACASGCLSILSSLVLWQLVIRHQASSVLRAYWASSFLDLSSAGAVGAWTGRCLIEIGNYGTREMGLPLLILSLVGAASLWRRPARLVLLVGPIFLAFIASALRLYPLGGRLLFFLVPGLWLLAARGIGVLSRRLPIRLAWLGWALPAALLLPAALWAGRLFNEVTPRCQFREAFAYVEAHREVGDILWVSHPQVYEVYYGRPPDLSAYSPPEMVARATKTSRLWMVCAVAGSRERHTAAETVARVKAVSPVILDRRRFRGLEVVLHGPPAKKGSFLSSASRKK